MEPVSWAEGKALGELSGLDANQTVSEMADTRIKGISIRTYLEVLEDEYGGDFLDQVLAGASSEVTQAVRYGAIVVGSWYPLSWYSELHALVNQTLKEPPSHSAKTGYLSTVKELNGIYRVFATLPGPSNLMKVGTKLFASYFERGGIQLVESRAGMMTAAWYDCDGFTEALWQDVVGGVRAVVETAGGLDVKTEVIEGGRDGDTTMTLRASWS